MASIRPPRSSRGMSSSPRPTLTRPPAWPAGARACGAGSASRSARLSGAEMAEYLVFIWDDEAAWANADPRTVEATMAAHEDFIARHVGALRGGNRLHTSDTATSIRHSADGGVAVSDGAFAETKEVIGGYYLIDAAALGEGLRSAGQVPAPSGGVEARPVRNTG